MKKEEPAPNLMDLAKAFRALEGKTSLPEALKALGLDQATLADYLGVHRSTITRYFQHPERWDELKNDPEQKQKLLEALALALERSTPVQRRGESLAAILYAVLEITEDEARQLAQAYVSGKPPPNHTFMS